MFSIDRYSPIPIYEQLIAQFERLILVGILTPNEMLPSVRALSQELSVNPNTIHKAYAELERRGLSQTAPGTGRFITQNVRFCRCLWRQKKTVFTCSVRLRSWSASRLPTRNSVLRRAVRKSTAAPCS